MGNNGSTSDSGHGKRSSSSAHFAPARLLKSSSLSGSHSDEKDIADFFNEQKDASSVDVLQRLWLRDGRLWTATFNNNREQLLHMAKLVKSLHVQSVDDQEKEKEIKLQITAELHINQEKFPFVLSKRYIPSTKMEKIANLESVQWELHMEWEEENASQHIVQSLVSKSSNQSVNNNDGIEDVLREYVKQFTAYILEWLSSENVEQFRVKYKSQQ
mmetsp:Transcript_39482/g.63156  ORF Transcript_39482/g.63156 Transcript_39482/m.63156 type:complete len:215 (-) Transcript_39482:1496-2140(-)